MSLNLQANEPKFPELEKVKFRPPQVKRVRLENGLVVYLQSDKTLPVVHLAAMVRTGKVYDAPEKVGIGGLVFSLLRDGGGANYKPEEIDKTLEYLGASVEASINMEEGRVTMFSLRKDFDKVFDILFDIMNAPAFEEDKYKLKRDEMLELIRRRNDKADREAVREAIRMFYGPAHPYGWRSEAATVNAITVGDLKNYHRNYFKANNIIVAVAGDFDEDEMLGKIKEKFSKMETGEVVFPKIPEVKLPAGRKVYLINKEISQSSVVLMMKGVKRHDDREYPLAVLSEYMGGGIQSKLGREIRSQRGLAYSVYSYFAKRTDFGFIQTYAGTKAQSVGQAVSEVLNQLELIKTAEPGEEFNMAKSQLINSFVFRFPTTFDIVNERASYEFYGYKPDYLDNYVEKMDLVSKTDMQNTAKEYYDTGKALIFVIGDAKKFDKPLSEFGEVEELKED